MKSAVVICRVGLALAAAGVSLACCVNAVRAQTMSASDLATYMGADRTQQLVEGAKKEGGLTIYSSLTTADMGKIIAAFQKKYGVKVNFWRGSSEDIRDRAIAETRNHRFDVDIVETAAPDLVAMNREKIFEPIKSPIDADLMKEAFIAGQNWVGTRISLITGAYNTDAIKAADVPKTFQDLVNPKYKGDLGIEAESDYWLMTLADDWGEKKAVDLFKNIVATNGVSVRKGHTLLANLTASGEVPISIITYSYKVDQLKDQGAPIARINFDPVVGLMTGLGIAAKAPHPYSALLFHDFYLTDGQPILMKLNATVVNLKYEKLPADLRIKFVDPVQWLDEDAKWSNLYKSIFITKAH